MDEIMSKIALILEPSTNSGDSLPFSSPAINEFPEDAFTLDQRREGAVLLHILCVRISSAHFFLALNPTRSMLLITCLLNFAGHLHVLCTGHSV